MSSVCTSSEIWLGISNCYFSSSRKPKSPAAAPRQYEIEIFCLIGQTNASWNNIACGECESSTHTVHIHEAMFFRQMRCTRFNNLEHFLFHNSKSECLSLKAHTRLQQLVIDAQYTDQSRSTQRGGDLVGRADNVHSVHHIYCNPLLVFRVFSYRGDI